MASGDSSNTGLLVRLGWLPIPVLLAAVIVTRFAGQHTAHDLPTLRLVLSCAFYTFVSVGTLLLVGRNFLAEGAPALLLLECGVVFWSLAGTVGDAVYDGDPNANVTIFNCGILLAGACHLAGSVLALKERERLRPTWLWLTVGIAVALGLLGLVTLAALHGWLPVFFVPGHGGTAARWGVLSSAIAMFLLSAVLFRAHGERLPFTTWYVRALLLLVVGLFGVMIQLAFGSAVNWLARVAQWLGGVYLLIAAIEGVRQSNLPLIPAAVGPRPRVFGGAMAVVAVLFAAAVRLAFLPAMGTRAPFVTFYPAVLLVALYGGWRAGLLAVLLSAALADYFWMLPQGLFSISHPGDLLAMAVFVLSASMITFFADGLRRAQELAREMETKVQIANARHRDLQALRSSEEKFVKAFQGNMAAMAITRLSDGTFLDVNDRWVEIVGYQREEAIGQTGPALGVWKSAEEREAFVRELGQNGTVHNREFIFVRKDGHEWTGLVAAQVSELEGEPIIITSLTDISERKRAEEALRAANLQLAEADKRKNDFLAVLSHELRNPLAPIRNSLYILEHSEPDSDRARRAIAIINRQTAQLVRLVDDLLDVTRITRNKIHLQRQRLDLGNLLHRTVEDQRSLFDASGVSLELRPISEAAWVDGDSSRLAQVVSNLLQNAAKFTPRGGSVTASLSIDEARGHAVVRVTDTGVGMTPDMLARLFAPFVQADATLDRSKGGLGLGLALVKGLVELHGGTVHAHSAGINQGAEFVVRLPLLEHAGRVSAAGETRAPSAGPTH